MQNALMCFFREITQDQRSVPHEYFKFLNHLMPASFYLKGGGNLSFMELVKYSVLMQKLICLANLNNGCMFLLFQPHIISIKKIIIKNTRGNKRFA